MEEFNEVAKNFKNLISDHLYDGTNIVYLKSSLKSFRVHTGNTTNWLKFQVADLPLGYDALIAVNKNDEAFYINVYNSFGNLVTDFNKDPFIGKNGLKTTISISDKSDNWLNLTGPSGAYSQIKNKGAGFLISLKSSGDYTFQLSDATSKPTPAWVWVMIVLIVFLLIFIGFILYFHFSIKGKVNTSVSLPVTK